MPTVAIWWIRRDLRLRDNLALQAALARGGEVLPLFILDPVLLGSRWHADAEKRKGFLFGGLRALDSELRRRGSRLVVRHGEPERELSAIVGETNATAIFAEEDYSPYAKLRDARISAILPLQTVGGVSVFHPGKVHTKQGKPFTTFAPFSRAWRSLTLPGSREIIGAPTKLPAVPEIPSGEIPESGMSDEFPPGEQEAHRRLQNFFSGPILQYSERRNLPGIEGTSRLSPYFRFGMLSAREAAIVAQTLEGHYGATGAWLMELIWREFFLSILCHFPRVLRTTYNARLRTLHWRSDAGQLRAWQEGRTGFPIVDAGMRQLRTIGWMHNRVRMITASFLAKDLLLDWREGERWFMRHLIDGDPAANNGGWQWTAGVGVDAAPYFRIFNPVVQGKRYDPEGAYVRRWVQELQSVPAKYIHEPWTMPGEVQKAAACAIGRDYPGPIVDRTETRDRALNAYRAAIGGKGE